MKRYAVWLPEFTTLLSDCQLAMCLPDRWERIAGYRRPMDQWRSAGSEWLLAYAMSNDFGIEEYEINKQTFGKPYLNMNPSIHFNWSHSGRMIVLAIDSHSVGIDIEKKQDIPISWLAPYFTIDEKKWIQSQVDPSKGIIEIWTKKESWIKQTGEGLYANLEAISTMNHPHIHAECICDYWIATASEKPIQTLDSIVWIEWKLLYEWIEKRRGKCGSA